MRQELKDLKTHIYEDGSISDAEVTLIASIFEAYGFAQDEARLLLDLNNILSGSEYPDSFKNLFVERLTGYLVSQEGEIDPGHWKWFSDRVLQDAQVDDLERRLIQTVVSRAKNPPDVSRLKLG